MDCPNCGAEWTLVTHTESLGGEVKRVRYCSACGLKFETLERESAAVRGSAFQAGLFQVITQDHRNQARELVRE